MNKLILGDNLEVLKNMESESVDLIYLDPPFFSNRNYEVIWGDSGEVRSFQDRFSGGIDHYIAWLKERVIEMHRILKPTGSIFLHCDWHANSYIRVFILDKIFGEGNMKNEIIWSYKRYTAVSKKFQNLHDTIFWYTKSKEYTFNEQREEYGENSGKMDSHYKQDEEGKWFRWQKRKGKEAYKVYLSEGRRVGDVWEMPILNASSKERIGYPTQKSISLLQRIIECASLEGDTILDPFVGGGTTVCSADKLGRKWLGIDQSVQAIKVTEYRLNAQQDLFSKPFITQLYKYDYDMLRYKDAFEFESWIVQQYGGYSNSKQRGDLGLDGRMPDNTPIQVKRSDGIGRNVVDNFLSAVQRYDKTLFEKNKEENKPVGIIIAFSHGKGAVQEVARLKNEENVIIKLVNVEDVVPIAKKPTIKIEVKDLGEAKEMREVAFTAIGESASGIEFYAWDFDYKEGKFSPEILLDKEGKQVKKFKAGSYEIAVKVVDKEGLDSLEHVKLQINGVVRLEK